MLNRKIEAQIEAHLKSSSGQMLIIDGARQVGKSFSIRRVGQRLFANYVEINMEADKYGDRLFANVRTTGDFYMALSVVAGQHLKDRDSTLVFIDELQAYPEMLTLLKFLMIDGRFTYVASGSLLGVTLLGAQSLPTGYIRRLHMAPLDFEEFLWANGVGAEAIGAMRKLYQQRLPLSEAVHEKVLNLFKKYLLVGGMPACVSHFLATQNIVTLRQMQNDLRELYAADAAKYEQESGRKLKIRRIYELIASNMENKKKRVVAKSIEGKAQKRMADYQDEFDYLLSAGIALGVNALTQPTFPLIQSAGKNLLKLYYNDVGLLTALLFHHNIKPVMEHLPSVNLGAVYETVVAQELRAHGATLFYYDNKQVGEVDYLVDDHEHLVPLPIEVKSGRDYAIHSALGRLLAHPAYHIPEGLVLSNERMVIQKEGVTYLPVYYVMFIEP